MSGPKLVINEPQDGFEVPPITALPPVSVQPPAGQPPAGVQPPAVAALISTAGQLPGTITGTGMLQAVQVTGQVTDEGLPEPVGIMSVTVQVDDGPLIEATLTRVPDLTVTRADFAASVAIPDIQGPHVIAVSATDDQRLSVTQTVTVFVGPSFQIAPAALLIEVNSLLIKRSSGPPYPAQSTFDRYAADIQPHLTWLAALLAKYGVTLAGPSMLVDPDRQVLRIGLWIGDRGFPAVAASPGVPLPTLSDVQAASCFAVTPPVLPVAAADYAVSVPTTTLQSLLAAAGPAISQAAARHDLTVDSLTAATIPPSGVAGTLTGTLPADVPASATITLTLGTQPLPFPVFPSQSGLAVIGTDVSSSTGSIVDWILDSLLALYGEAEVAWVLPYEAIDFSSDASGKAAEITSIANELLAALPYEIPFRNTAFSTSDPLSEDFPVVDLGWTSFGTTDTGIVAGGQVTLTGRQQSDVSLSIQANTKITLAESQTVGQLDTTYSFRLQNLDPDSFTWTLSLSDVTRASAGQPGVTLAEGAIAAGPFAQAGGFTVPIRLPLGPGHLAVSVRASETCGTDPAKVLTAAWSSPIAVEADPHPPAPGEPGHQPF